MILNKLLAAAAAVVLGFALAHVDDARHGANNGHSADGARKTTAKTTAMAQSQNPGGQPATAQGADNSSPPSPEGRAVVDGRHSGYRSTAYGSLYGNMYGGTYGTMSGSVYVSLNGDDGGGPLIYWAPGRLYPVSWLRRQEIFHTAARWRLGPMNSPACV
jgi:hypothetical protein